MLNRLVIRTRFSVVMPILPVITNIGRHLPLLFIGLYRMDEGANSLATAS